MNLVEAHNMHVLRWYRFSGTMVLFVSYYEAKHGIIRIVGYRPQDYAAFCCEKYFADFETGCTIAMRERIPLPEPVELTLSIDAKVEELSIEEAYQSEHKNVW
ncbi:MAG TPA: hypothetical protein VH593_23345 [Ktedonobacteraceae bacterium]